MFVYKFRALEGYCLVNVTVSHFISVFPHSYNLLLSNVKTVPRRDQDPLYLITFLFFSQIFPKNENFETFYFH
jgi:hypothetical protein